ncbi:MAG: ABC transporter ATP-binding protein/permease [Clostridia bacterium]|nr:ABC transporter ATP-binding protein/permease [Clostridia bacterium]
MLKLQGIKKDYVTQSETVRALRGVDLCFRKSEFVSILGPSGCGKTTLLNIIGGLDHYTDGDLVINGRSTRSFTDRDWDVYRNHRIGFVFQSYNLIPHQTVLGNVELALTIAGVDREERIARAKHALDRVGLSGQYYKRPNQLSGGQCQRVAIARALVNDPEILLADEPTGALDTETSVQIMDLIKEISGERLVIMVTHNPELAEKYSTRIIRLLDGRVTEDTRPFSEADEAREIEAESKSKPTATAPENSGKKRHGKEKAKMSFFTAFRLSARNLISKKGRTTMVGIAGSIGIIGIAMVLAFSAGIKGYVASMQDDMLSGNPITITESTYDLGALTDMMDMEDLEEIKKEYGKVYIASIVEYLTKSGQLRDSLAVENEITQEYIDYVKELSPDAYNAMLFDYGIDLNNNLYTDFELNESTTLGNYSVSAITAMYTSILKKTEFADYASYVSLLAPNMRQLPDSHDYILSQYELVSGDFASGKNQIMLVLDADDRLSDLLLARFGFYTEEQFLEIVKKADDEESYDKSKYKEYFTYEELLGKSFTWYPNSAVFTEAEPFPGYKTMGYNHSSDGFSKDGAVELEVVGILSPRDTINYGSLSAGIYYTSALTEHILAENEGSAVTEYVKNLPETDTTAGAVAQYYFIYSYEYVFEGETFTEPMATVGPSTSMADLFGSMMGGGSAEFDHEGTKDKLIRNLGGNSVANAITIYPKSFDQKGLVTDHLDKWNADGEHQDITYTDTLELVINMINTMIDVISYALIAFTSISLVVSTVMIGIITYVSVVERIKEIGVIRALGGRKRDVSSLFTAETVIIGLLSGLIGVGFTYFASIIVNAILKPLINYPNIAALPVSDALLLVLLSVVLTLVSGLLPARSAARKDPVVALRTE